jgi:hypothetical protein
VCSLDPFLGLVLCSLPIADDIELSINIYLTWMRDMKVVHPVARWCWRLPKVIYKDHELVKELE